MKVKHSFTILILVLFMFTACKNESNPGFISSVNKESQFAPIEGFITFKFKTEDSLNLVVARLNHQNEYCSLHLYLEYKKKVIDKITLPKLINEYYLTTNIINILINDFL